jgi:hypothetical protein
MTKMNVMGLAALDDGDIKGNTRLVWAVDW